MAAAVFTHQRQLSQRPHRPVAAQDGISRLEQRVRTSGQAQREAFGALGNDRQYRADVDGVGGSRPLDLRDEYAVDGGGPVEPGMSGRQDAGLVETHAFFAAHNRHSLSD
ncbi:hypothetical protein OG589_09495 [Sphaerisporangium sp. NBC_01403]|uniref:hypothetical protein n=1 Tax=Sphaerisporangium sp. NBC_01403 TaxID=2903599 RepID=UPI0032459FB2